MCFPNDLVQTYYITSPRSRILYPLIWNRLINRLVVFDILSSYTARVMAPDDCPNSIDVMVIVFYNSFTLRVSFKIQWKCTHKSILSSVWINIQNGVNVLRVFVESNQNYPLDCCGTHRTVNRIVPRGNGVLFLNETYLHAHCVSHHVKWRFDNKTRIKYTRIWW